MRPELTNPIQPGTRVRVEQHIVHGVQKWQTIIEGEVVQYQLEPTGSWYAHGHHDKLWLPRLRIRKSDGEISALNLDANSRIVLRDNP